MTGRQGGWLSANDIRALENMDGIGPQGDIYLQPLNMEPAGESKPAGKLSNNRNGHSHVASSLVPDIHSWRS